MAPPRAGPYTDNMRGRRLFAIKRELEQAADCVMRNCLRGSPKALSQASTIVKMMASLLMTMSIVTADGAIADERLESPEKMVPQRPGMKTEADYQRFAQERGLPQRSEPT